MKVDNNMAALSAFDMKINQNGLGKDEKLEEVASQFEAIFLNMTLKEMRKGEEAFENDIFSSSQEKFYRDMLDQQMALELSSKQGIGLKEALVKQLNPHAREK